MGILFRAVGATTIFASSALVIMFFILASDVIPGARMSFVPWLAVTVVVVAIGQIWMMVHLYSVAKISGEDKSQWTRHLGWGGPFVAGYYLWLVGGGLIARRVDSSVEDDSRRTRRLLMTAMIGLATSGFIGMLAELSRRSTTSESRVFLAEGMIAAALAALWLVVIYVSSPPGRRTWGMVPLAVLLVLIMTGNGLRWWTWVLPAIAWYVPLTVDLLRTSKSR